MDMKEAEERVVIAKPVATKPTCTNFNSVSELLAGAIRPKTARFKPIVNHPPASLPSTQVESCGIAASSDKIRRSEIKSTVLYKPQAKFVSKTTISILSNMPNVCAYQGTVPSSKARAEHPKVDKLNNQSNVASDCYCEVERTSESLRLTSQNCQEEEDPKALAPVTNGDRPSYDGYNWRKYGQKQVKGSEYPRSYYKCTHPNCPVKKKVERSFDGGIAEIVYRGEHNHPKPQPPKRNESGMQALGLGTEVTTGPDKSAPLENNCVNQRNETSDSKAENQNDIGLPAAAAYSTCQQDKSLLSRNHAKTGSSNAGEVTPDLDHSCGLSKECDDGCRGDDEPRSKRWKSENQSTDQAGTIGVDPQEPHAVIRSSAEPEMLSDGFRWRKYGQKVVKGNPYPRSYYRCTGLKCNVRKHVERALDDPSAFVTTYEGKHNHEMPLRSTKPVAPESDLQSPDLQR